MRAMTMMSMMLCRTRYSVLVADDSRCDRHGMIALKATLCLSSWSSALSFFCRYNDNDDDVFR